MQKEVGNPRRSDSCGASAKLTESIAGGNYRKYWEPYQRPVWRRKGYVEASKTPSRNIERRSPCRGIDPVGGRCDADRREDGRPSVRPVDKAVARRDLLGLRYGQAAELDHSPLSLGA